MPKRRESITFAARLRRLRGQASLTQEELARAAGLQRLAIVRLEAGQRRPTLETAQKLAVALNQSLSVFDDCC